jgi:Domain of unknown function (DUF4263)
MNRTFEFDKTYELRPGPAPEAFQSYADRVASEFAVLLDSRPNEPTVQGFLEQNPCLVPGLRSLGIYPSAYPCYSMLISQPSLPGLRVRRPDFMWIAGTSVAVYPTLIEIESPIKRLFTARRSPTATFSQARHQLTQWKAWFTRPENVQKFISDYSVTKAPAGEAFEPRFILIYGRRAEFENDPELKRERACLLDGEVESLTSYDRLTPDPMLANVITVRATGSGRFRAIAAPPTFTLGPIDADCLPHIDGLSEVLRTTTSIPVERRQFLLERLPYWENWAQEGRRGMIASWDRE